MPRPVTLLFAPNLKGWTGFSFTKAFSKSLGVCVAVDNDANAAVWGGYAVALEKEAAHGRRRHPRHRRRGVIVDGRPSPRRHGLGGGDWAYDPRA